MKQVIPPHFISEKQVFPSFSFDQGNKIPVPDSLFGQISQDGLWSWRVKDAVLDIFSTTKEERCATWNFGAIANDPSICIVAVSEFVTRIEQPPSLVVVLGTESESSIMCLLESKTSKVLKIIEIPARVSNIEVVTTQGGASMETRCLCQELRFMFGIVAVGLHGGRVLLVDLCIDERVDTMDFVCNQMIYITKKTHNIAGRRENAILHCQHLCLPLNDDACNHNKFNYRSEDGNLIGSVAANDVYVSSLKYLPHLCMLAVGFNFGGFQLWNLQKMSLEYTCTQEEDTLPVVQFAFQEPENDPRNFCYLWTVRGQTYLDSDSPDCISVASLYSLTFEGKEWLNNYGFVYQVLLNCTHKFEFPLVADPFRPEVPQGVTSRLVTCYSIQQGEPSSLERSEQDSLHGEDWNNQDLSLCIFCWETWSGQKNLPSSCYLALFDINQWYQARMPNSPSNGRLCPYIGLFSLVEVGHKIGYEVLQDVHLNSRSLAKFQSLSSAEQFYYPSALSFSLNCLTDNGICTISYLGFQRLVLSRMTSTGPECLIEPRELYNMCSLAGLFTPALSDVNAGSASYSAGFTVTARESLLSLALEYDLIPFLISCIHEWSAGVYSHLGCTAKVLLEWSWKKVCSIRKSIDKLCMSLFNCSGQQLDQNTLRILHSYESQLEHIYRILTMLDTNGGPITEQGHRELGMRKEATKLISTYLKVILWLYNCRLLPEHLEGEAYGEDEVAYPASTFRSMYDERRLELTRLHSAIQKTDILLVDGMINSMGPAISNLWEKKMGGTSLYPPPSLLALITVYLQDSVSMIDKHSLMLYFLLDMATFLSDRQSHLVERIMRFPAAFNLNPNHVKITQGLWLLDHRDFQEALSTLLDPMIKPSDLLPWQYTRILKAFLYQGEHQKALRFRRIKEPPVQNSEDVKLHLTILLANGLISEAFQYLKQNGEESNMEDLLNHFFLGCEQTHSLDILFRLPFSQVEEEALMQFLQNSPLPQSKEIAVAYLLQRNRPLDAAQMNEKLKHQSVNPKSQAQSHESIRNSIVQGFLKILPDAQNKLVSLTRMCNPTEVSALCLSPISSVIHTSSLPLTSQSNRFKSILDHINGMRNISPVNSSPFANRLKGRKYWTAENYPFIRTPTLPNFENRGEIREVIFPSPTNKEDTSHLADQDELVSPAKRRRYMDNVTPFKPQDIGKRWSPSRMLNAEIQSVLQSTPVRQKSPTFSPLHSRSAASARITPQSILKVRQMLRRSVSPSLGDNLLRSRQTSESSVSKDEASGIVEDEIMNDDSVAEDDSSSKQLRFVDGSQLSTSYDESRSHRSPLLKYDSSGICQLVQSSQRLHKAILLTGDTPDNVVVDEEITINLARRKMKSDSTEDYSTLEETSEPSVAASVEEPRTPSPIKLRPDLRETAGGDKTPPLEEIEQEEENEEQIALNSEDQCEMIICDDHQPITLASSIDTAASSAVLGERTVSASEVPVSEAIIVVEQHVPTYTEEQPSDYQIYVGMTTTESLTFQSEMSEPEQVQPVIVASDVAEIAAGKSEIFPVEMEDDEVRMPSIVEEGAAMDRPLHLESDNEEPPLLKKVEEYSDAKEEEEIEEARDKEPLVLPDASTVIVAREEVEATSDKKMDNANFTNSKAELSETIEESNEDAVCVIQGSEEEVVVAEQNMEENVAIEEQEEDIHPEKTSTDLAVQIVVQREATPESEQDVDKSSEELKLPDEDSVSLPDVLKSSSTEPSSSPYLGTRSRTRPRSITPEGKQGSETSSRTSSPAALKRSSRTSSPATPKGSSRTSSPATPRVSPRTQQKEKEAAGLLVLASKRHDVQASKSSTDKKASDISANVSKKGGKLLKTLEEMPSPKKGTKKGDAKKVVSVVPKKSLKDTSKTSADEKADSENTPSKSEEKRSRVPKMAMEGRKGNVQKAASAVLKKSIKNGQKKMGEIPRFTFSVPIVSEEPSAVITETLQVVRSPSFIFSPPVTRSKTRRKKPEEASSEFMEKEKPTKFVDPLLESPQVPSSSRSTDTKVSPATSIPVRKGKGIMRVRKAKLARKGSGVAGQAISPGSTKVSEASGTAASGSGQPKSPKRHGMSLRKTRFGARKSTKM